MVVVSTLLLVAGVTVAQSSLRVRASYRPGDFKLVLNHQAADLVVDAEDYKVVQLATNDLKVDVQRVAGQTPRVLTTLTRGSQHAVIVGTLGRSKLIDSIVESGKLDASHLKGKWESFLIATIPNPVPNVSLGLVIAGSDRRGTAFGVYELSQAIGVSPWNWWADVEPRRQTNLVVVAGVKRFGPPSVKYRGIFLNDEDWGLQPWAAKTYEPERGDIGPKTYTRIFELLLRLKANTVWPAMHACTRPFNSFPENKQTADDFGIIMGSSHAEPMLRNNVGEWKSPPEEYDFTKNPSGVRKYWEDRVSENGRFENIYTIGMRGIHDSPIQGPKTGPERISLLEQIFAVQRELLARHVSPEVERVPQIFCPYKEVLTDYQHGLKVPDDVTIVFPDDNFGYLRYFPTPEERKRPGGFGVYYHISYLGRPLSYLWLNTTPPSLIWEEMSKAYEHGVDRFWMLNVGDLKPAEIGIEFFLEMAWDIKRWRRDNLSHFLNEWARREFGPYDADEIASIMRNYYELGFARKPEHLQWYLPNEQPRPSDFSSVDYGDEVQSRLDAYDDLLLRAERVKRARMPRDANAFFELVWYPVYSAVQANRLFFLTEKSALYALQRRASAVGWSRRAEDARKLMQDAALYYNERLAGGRWRHMMSIEMTPGQWPSMRTTWAVTPRSVREMRVPNAAGLGVAIEGRAEPVAEQDSTASLPLFNGFNSESHFVDVYNTGRTKANWIATSSDKWIKLSKTTGDLSSDVRIWVSIDWALAPRTSTLSGSLEIKAAGASRKIAVNGINRTSPGDARVFYQLDGVVSIQAEHFSRKLDRTGAGWQVIPGLGRMGDSVSVFPTTAQSIQLSRISQEAPSLQYDLNLSAVGEFKVLCYLVPTHPLHAGQGLRLAIGLDDQKAQIVTVGAGMEVPSREWSQNVLNATTIGTTTLTVTTAGLHTLRLFMIDPGVIVDKIVIDSGGLRPSYLGPPETLFQR
jgi:hypothetical protein